MAASLSVS